MTRDNAHTQEGISEKVQAHQSSLNPQEGYRGSLTGSHSQAQEGQEETGNGSMTALGKSMLPFPNHP